MTPAVDRFVALVDALDPGGVRGLYLCGSAVAGGLRPDSDVDLLLVTERSLNGAERAALLDLLLRFSGRRATVQPGRPLEVTSVVLAEVVPWTYPPRCDFLYGEWLRTAFADGRLPAPGPGHDLAVVLTGVHQHARALRGPEAGVLLPTVPAADLRQCLRDSLGPLLEGLVGDERNVLLTLARMVATLDTGDILTKDAAARLVAPDLAPGDRALLHLAAGAYLGEVADDWTTLASSARRLADELAQRVRARA